MTTNNHPANGHVSLDRLHQISEILSKASAQSDGGNLGYAMADAVKVIDGAIAEFEEQDNPRPVMAVKGELGFIDNLEKIIEERDEDIDIGQLGRSNYDALMIAALDAFRASPPVVPSEMTPIIEDGEIIAYERHGERFSTIVGATWNACRAAMLQGADGKPELTVWYGAMPETNGKTNWTAMLHRKGHHPWEGITIDRSEYPGRVRYEADRMRHLIGELADKPDILAYDSDAHSGYVEPVTTAYKLRDAVEIIRNSGIEIDAEKIFAERDVLNTPDCWCRTCRPVTVTDMRFVVCPDCGNKRCPHANDHRNACTGSNEPGQEGGEYPAAPQQEVK